MNIRYYVLSALLTLTGVLGLAAWSPLLGVVRLTTVDSLVHLVSGLCLGYAATQGLGPMRLWGKIVGFGYLALAIAGFVMDAGGVAWLHLGVAAICLYHALLAPPTL
jgi:hypothetical protein